ncbi:MAG: HAMP domain-containing protein [Armatimonadetes bacterium]|nr:HAMP domain-containing protein [Armatimonadota bacterium]
MSRSLRTELLQSHLLLVVLLLVVCLIAVAGFFRVGQSVNRILEDNYKSVVAAQNMKEALERLDSAAAFFVAGQEEQARKQARENLPLFDAAYRVEAANITEPGEQEISDDLGEQFASYRADLSRLLQASPTRTAAATQALYFDRLQPRFVRVKKRVQDVLDLNQAAIVHADERARTEARNAVVASVAVTALAVLLGLGLAQRSISAAMTPIASLTRQAAEIGAGRLDGRIETRRADEIGILAQTFNDMAERLAAARRRETERVERAERVSDAALADLYDPVVVTDAGGKVVHLNHAAEGLFGSDERAQGRDVGDVVRTRPLYIAVLTALGKRSGDTDAGEMAQMTWAGRTYRVRVNPMRGEGDALLGAVAVLEDITREQEIDRIKTQFIGVASHELRTPVTSLLLGVQILDEGVVGELNPEQREVTAALREDLLRLERMMRDLLDITRLEAGATPPRFEVAKPGDLVSGAVRGMQSQAEAKNVSLTIEPLPELPTVRADRGQIGRVLTNLLSNAVRHTPAGGAVRVSAQLVGDAVRFTVSDSGTGIPAEYLERIWERFVQVPGATRGGAGLGLSLVQNIVTAHGGTVNAESVEGAGSRFAFTLPVAEGRTM